jgi:hypothetical protein
MDKKIMICGASGTGKTTMAKHIAELYELPYITTSASQTWGKFGFTSHEDALRKSLSDPSLGLRYQLAVLLNRRQILNEIPHYITDRSYVDNITYLLLQMGYGISQGNMEIFLKDCKIAMSEVDGLIFLRWNKDIVLEDNGKRIMNRIYHEMVDNTMRWILTSRMAIRPFLEVLEWDMDSRVKLVDTWIKSL